MKLIDILVQELPKRGGWPEGVAAMAQDADGAVQNYGDTADIRIYDDLATGNSRISRSYSVGSREVSVAIDRLTAIITREQYETALKQSVWDGTGLPPVGSLCRYRAYTDTPWIECKVLSYHENEVWLQRTSDYVTFIMGNPHLHPIRSERDEAIETLASIICGDIPDTGMATALMYATRVYDAGYRKLSD